MEEEPEYEIAIIRVSGDAPACDERLQNAIEEALRRHSTSRARLSVALVDDAHMARLNELHLDHTGPTDVLAFDLSDEASIRANRAHAGSEAHAARPTLDGDIAISVDTAAREAAQRGHSIEAELALYALHGTLHLLGYDDKNEQDAARMHAFEDDILTTIGFGPVYGARAQ